MPEPTGWRIIEGVAVTGLETRDGAVCGVRTESSPHGDEGDHLIETETVVLATGMWTRHLAAQIGVNVPLQACEHFYVVTEPLEGLDTSTPIVRDPTNFTYFKEETGKLMVGFFEPQAKVWRLDGIPRDFKFGTLPEDWDHVGPVFERSCHRVPALADCGVQLFFNGPESFTPDGTYYLGEAPEVDGCFVAAGFNSVGIQSAGGAGWVLADWIADRHPPMDLSAVDIRRAMPFQADDGYLAERISESLGLLYAMHWPFFQYTSARDQRRSALHDAMDVAGRGLRRNGRLGAGQLVRRARPGARVPLQLRQAELVRELRPGMRCGAQRSRALRPVIVRQVHGERSRCARRARHAQRGVDRCACRPCCLYPMVQRARRHRSRPDGDPAARRRILGRDIRGQPDP